MTPEQIIQILHACKTAGVSAFRMGDLDIAFKYSSPEPEPAKGLAAWLPDDTMKPQAVSSITPEEEKEIKHKVEELTSIMKLDDAALIDRMFPLPEESEGVA